MIQILKVDKKGYRFCVKSRFGNPLLESELFDTKEQAEGMLKVVQANPIFERKTNHEGKFLIYLKGNDGKKIAESKPYSSEAGMENGIKNVKTFLSQSSLT